MEYYRAKEREHFIKLGAKVIPTDFLSPIEVAKKIGDKILKELKQE
jgi:hypothetical protein